LIPLEGNDFYHNPVQPQTLAISPQLDLFNSMGEVIEPQLETTSA
jgi:hypothetical protein